MTSLFLPWAKGPESSTTLYFDEAHQVVAPVGRQTTLVFGGVYQNEAPRAKSVIDDCQCQCQCQSIIFSVVK